MTDLVSVCQGDTHGSAERRRRSIEVLEERARTLGAAISVDHDELGSTMRIVLPMYAVSE